MSDQLSIEVGPMDADVPLIRDHEPAVRDVLRRAGLSMQSELTPSEVLRAQQAVALFPNGDAARNIRNYIRPPREEDE